MIRLRKGNIIVKLLPRPDIAVGGLTLIRPEKSKRWQEDQIECEVTHVGPWVDEVKVGDKVILEGHEGRWMDRGIVDSEGTYRLCKTNDILAVIEPVPALEVV